ncbi:MAG: hypothetical protein ACR2OG_09735 [Gemmatimonadaceae bacterium]
MRTNDSGEDLPFRPTFSSTRGMTRVPADAAELSASLVADIRQRVTSGEYDSASVIERVARRIVERGDL